jgi:nicotinate-nucleotide pyrophosphorylase (carboxylating)
MPKHHQQVAWDEALEHDLHQLIRMTIAEDLSRQQDWTTVSLVPEEATAAARVVSREQGVIAGLPVGPIVIQEMNADVTWTPIIQDGDVVEPKQAVAEIAGNVRHLLVAERTILNFVGKLSGVATSTSAFVAKTDGTRAVICDTRKTLPGWRRIQKYAVRQGGGTNHRLGLYDAVLIKDNHIAFGNQSAKVPFGIAEAVHRAREFVARSTPDPEMIIEIEVDSLEQLAKVLPANPDIVLLDNMTTDQLRQAVAMRDDGFASVSLEASGGVRIDTVAAIADTGVDRISVGALTHSSPNFDVGLDWL